MDSDLEDLESLLSDHFGLTPSVTPAASQNDSDVGEPLEANADAEAEIEPDDVHAFTTGAIQERARAYLDVERGGNETDSDDNGSENGGTELYQSNDNDNDDDDILQVRMFVQNDCGCKRKCNTRFGVNQIYEHILNIRDMSKEEKEMYLMGVLVNDSDKEQTNRGKKRKRSRTIFSFSGKIVCRKTFLLAYDIGRCALINIVSHCNKHGPTPRTHGNTGKKPTHALIFEDVQRVVQFITNYADELGMPQPAAPRGRDNVPPIYLTCQTTKNMVHTEYDRSCQEAGQRSVKRSTFSTIWSTCLDHIKIASPRDDVCATCEKLRKAIMDSVSEEDKLTNTNSMRDHVLSAQRERSVYNECIKQAKETHDQDPLSRYNHYTFDYSQNVCIPHHARQMGPVYFTTLRKIQIFGFRIDGTPQQLNFLIDENETIGQDGQQTHGPNAVISMVDWALGRYGEGETSCGIHADNCPGQNKNQYMIGYFMWRVMTGQHMKIEYHMQVPGHARCLVDSGFAYLKKLYRRSDCDTMDQVERVAELSASTNTAVRYPSWPWRDWKTFLSQTFKPLIGIRKYQYFRVVSEEPGVVAVRTGADACELKINILKNAAYTFTSANRPVVVPAAGLSHARQNYLFRTVRPYVRPEFQDVTCPVP